ncbi:MAG: ExbD/TolR family protein [Verrucomicrobiota bacterium]
MNFRKNLQTRDPGFPLAPMIDIMFLLVIFFMASAIYSHWETKIGITVPTADSSVQGARQPGEIIINLAKDGEMVINGVVTPPNRLKNLLGHVAERFREQPVIIRADADTPHREVVKVLDICRQVDIWNVAFATLPDKSEE